MSNANLPNEYRIYRPNNNGEGVAFSFQLSYKKDEKFNKWQLFMMASKQEPNTRVKDAKFRWDDKVTVKLGDSDIGAMLSVLNGWTDKVGKDGSLFHQTPSGGNKIIQFLKLDNGIGLKIRSKENDNVDVIERKIILSLQESAILKELLSRAIVRMFSW